MALNVATAREACLHLRNSDPLLGQVINAVGPFTLRPQRDRFGMLVRSIISQQISVAAARSIRLRLEQSVAPNKLSAEAILRLEIDQLRTAGVSPQKAVYLRDLASRVNNGSVRLRTIGHLSDESVIEHLTQVKGIGRWTAQMFLIFSLGRPDVFPVDDLGVRTAIRNLYGLNELPGKESCLEIASRWRPFSSVASWYCWKSLDLARVFHVGRQQGREA